MTAKYSRSSGKYSTVSTENLVIESDCTSGEGAEQEERMAYDY